MLEEFMLKKTPHKTDDMSDKKKFPESEFYFQYISVVLTKALWYSF